MGPEQRAEDAPPRPFEADQPHRLDAAGERRSGRELEPADAGLNLEEEAVLEYDSDWADSTRPGGERDQAAAPAEARPSDLRGPEQTSDQSGQDGQAGQPTEQSTKPGPGGRSDDPQYRVTSPPGRDKRGG